jgi:hypothetical protein
LNHKKIATVQAPEIFLDESEMAGEGLLKFYKALGWNGEDYLDPCRIRTTQAVYTRLYDLMLEKCPDSLAIGFFMVNTGPGVDSDVPENTVFLLEGWVKPAGDSSV